MAQTEFLETPLLECYLTGMIAVHRFEPPIALEIGERPCASPVARAQAARDMQKVTNLRHKRVELSPFERTLIQQLDGDRDTSGLLGALLQLAEAGALTIARDETPITDSAQLTSVMQSSIDAALRRFARQALLLAQV
jgi:hypothetical protein